MTARQWIAGITLAVGAACAGAEEQVPDVPLYENLGSHTYAISTDVPAAQQYFDQGLRLYYAFNHAEAIRAFRAAAALDGRCAMCYWGEAAAWGPNINLPMDSASGAAAYAAIQRAQELAEHASEREQALIEAMGVRYAADPTAERAPLDEFDAGGRHQQRVGSPDLDVILDIPVRISMEVGNTEITIRNLLQLNQGSVIELDRLAGEPLDVLVNGTLIAHGEVVVVNEKFGIRMTDVISPSERIKKLR